MFVTALRKESILASSVAYVHGTSNLYRKTPITSPALVKYKMPNSLSLIAIGGFGVSTS